MGESTTPQAIRDIVNSYDLKLENEGYRSARLKTHIRQTSV
jgi:hypothetical protein